MSAHSDEAGLSRRTVLTRSATGAGIMLSGSFSGLFGSGSASASPAGRGKPGGVGYGALVPDPKGLLSLPEGFSYKVVAQSGVTKLESGEM